MKFFTLIELNWYNKKNPKVHLSKSRNPDQELRMIQSDKDLNKSKYPHDLWLCASTKVSAIDQSLPLVQRDYFRKKLNALWGTKICLV